MPQLVSALSPNASLRRVVTKPSVHSAGGIVVTQNRVASEIGARVLKAGGHAIDAAIAASFALGVVEPWMSGIGGVGAMLVYDAKSGRVVGIDAGAVSPMALDPADYPLTGRIDASDLFGWAEVVGGRNIAGAMAVATPSLVKGLGHAHARFGRRPWRDLVEPAAALARSGPVVDWHTVIYIASALRDLQKDAGAARRFLPGGGVPVPPFQTGADPLLRLPMPDLARTLDTLAEAGAGALYTGPLAAAIGADMAALGGSLRPDDLAAYQVREWAPLEIAHGGRSIHVLPELNGGPTLAVAFAELQRLRAQPEAAPGTATFLAYARALRHAWADRFARMGDAGDRTAATSTTHICTVDRDGNMVTLTQTLLSLFGARVVCPQTGILMNNGINWFDPRPGGPNSIAPGRRALANYAPAIMTGADAVVALGGCGGRKILPAVFQLLALLADFGMDLDQALATPRLDVSGSAVILADPRLGDATHAALAAEFAIAVAAPTVYPYPYAIAGAVRRVGTHNEGATEPEHPWSEAVAEDAV